MLANNFIISKKKLSFFRSLGTKSSDLIFDHDHKSQLKTNDQMVQWTCLMSNYYRTIIWNYIETDFNGMP